MTVKEQLSIDALRAMPEGEYMNEDQLSFFQTMLQELRKETRKEIDEARRELFKDEREPDIVDIASNEDERARELRFINRKLKYIEKIDHSLERIKRKEYGYCDATGRPIGIERLLLRPTATLCVEAKKI